MCLISVTTREESTLNSNQMNRDIPIQLQEASSERVELRFHHQSFEYAFGLRKVSACLRQTMDANVLVPVILFVILTPGLILALPPGQTLLVQTLTHAVVFAGVYWGLRQVFPQYY